LLFMTQILKQCLLLLSSFTNPKWVYAVENRTKAGAIAPVEHESKMGLAFYCMVLALQTPA